MSESRNTKMKTDEIRILWCGIMGALEGIKNEVANNYWGGG